MDAASEAGSNKHPAQSTGVLVRELLKTLPPEVAEDLLAESREKFFDIGRVLLIEGSRSPWVYLLLTGCVQVILANEGDKPTGLALVGPGEFLGDIAAIKDQPHTGSVQCLAACRMLVIPGEVFLQLMRRHWEFNKFILQLQIDRLLRKDRLCEHCHQWTPAQKVAAALLDLAKRLKLGDSSAWVSLPAGITEVVLSRHIRVGRDIISTCIKSWKRQQWVSSQSGRRLVFRLSALRNLLENPKIRESSKYQ